MVLFVIGTCPSHHGVRLDSRRINVRDVVIRGAWLPADNPNCELTVATVPAGTARLAHGFESLREPLSKPSFSSSVSCGLLVRTEVRAIDPHAMQDDGHFARQSHAGLLVSGTFGKLRRPTAQRVGAA